METLFGLGITIIFIIAVVFFVGALLEEEKGMPIGGFVICIFILCFSLVSFFAGKEKVQKEAVIVGTAKYEQIVDKYGNVSNNFVWISKK